MRSVNLIPKSPIELIAWKDQLTGRFPKVWIDHSEILAKNEGQPEGVLNELVVEDGDYHVDLLDRPTTVREYEPDELETLRQIVGCEPQQFFAVDYTDEGLLRRVLGVLLQHEGPGEVVVEDDQSNLMFLEKFLRENDRP